MKPPTHIFLALAFVVQAQDAVFTWASTAWISDDFSSSVTVQYGNTSVHPVPTSTASIHRVTSYINEAVASKNVNRTTWSTVMATAPLESRWDIAYTTGTTPPPTVTVEGTATETVWTSPTVATVTFAPTSCINGGAAPKSTFTEYTGEYKPFPGQITTTKTAWPTAVTTYYYQTASYRVFTFTGSTATFTSTATGTTYLSTTTLGTQTIDVNAVGRYYTRTRYRHTVTRTNRDHQLAYTTKPIEMACEAETRATVTRAAQCAPTNLIRERDGRGIEVRVPTANWTFPIGFPKTLIGIPGLDASACCQLCLDNKGCAASEWRDSWSGGCSLFFFNSPELNDTCGTVPLEYFADVWSLPEHTSFIQVGCGSLTYLGVRNQFCPSCKVD
ncbi:hypothetical protein B0T14DRAFT_567016 [Immersiella caudata]|uniref:Apple domain-containing protein n=1 Tax=Immersiella caudata TaxID=314043 RepID=A0AA39WRH3_9PEZI|nr:hypothetical protein B0T14DRAFT_567016 [Immersiella caudata]